jgi:hypothetical protein
MATVSSCPNCGAPVELRWSQAVQTTCAYCRSVLVRHEMDLAKVGEVAELPVLPSPIQLGTEGRWGDASFVVVGRIVYEYERGGWSEWHFVTNEGKSGWLSDAQLEYAVTFLADPKGQLPPEPGALRQRQPLRLAGRSLQLQTVTRARYRGVEGELPFEYWDKSEVFFADLRSRGREFATIDYSEPAPLFFAGESVEYDELRLTNVREFEGWEAR